MSKNRGCLRQLFLTAAIFLLTLGAGAFIYWYSGPYRGFGGDVFVQIDRGTPARAIGEQLAGKRVIRSPWVFLAVRAIHPGARLQAGEYHFNSAQSVWQVFDKIRRGEVYFEDFTVPEGSNMFDIAAALERRGTMHGADFLKASANPALIRDLDGQAPTLEGFLFPSTYRITRKTTADHLCLLMTSEFRKQWRQHAGSPNAGEVHRLVTLASLIEKETGLPEERPLVAAVFVNRLEHGIPLQCDPTTVYASILQKRYHGIIHRSDLTSVNPYNTYAHPGLPPGPITNPGISALDAALHPAPSGYLYFVAKPDGSGHHQFSSTLTEHSKAVEAYRKGLR